MMFLSLKKESLPLSYRRLGLLSLFLLILAGLVIARLIHLHITHTHFLRAQGDARTLRVVDIPSYRGMITDRRGTPLAISTPVEAVWINPQHFAATPEQLRTLAKLLGYPPKMLTQKIAQHPQRGFIYLKRGIAPALAQKIKALGIGGVYIKREFHRYYPAGKQAAQLIGFTDIDDQGQAGLELTFEDYLKPTIGKKKVLEDRTGKWVQDVEQIQAAQSGQDIALSIDLRIQSIASNELEKAVKQYQAKSATLVMLDILSGEVLAMVSAPSFNPNNRAECQGIATRNRAMTDQIEPGSTIKTFAITSALASGHFTPETLVDTSPGTYVLNKHVIKDFRNYGVLSLKDILSKSSNVGISKVTLSLPAHALIDTFKRLGLGETIHTAFPGESKGRLPPPPTHPFVHATLAFGYSLAVTPLQLVQAYSILGAKGIKRPVSLTKIEDRKTIPTERIFSEKVAQDTLTMLTEVIAAQGTGLRAKIPGYHTAGKTGTTRVVGPKGYDPNRHMALFVGITPVNHPRLATLVIVEEPQESHSGGGLAAAPIYKNVVSKALYILNIPPDNNT